MQTSLCFQVLETMAQQSAEEWHQIRSHFKDKEANRRQTLPDHPPRRHHWDWLVISGDRHFARNRSAFKEYCRIRATAQGARVVGVGTVELCVRCNPADESTATLVLENVLHIPGAVCNGFSAQLKRDAMSCKKEIPPGLDREEECSSSWYTISSCGLTRLVLAGDPQEDSLLQDESREEHHVSAVLIDLHLDAEEEYHILKQEIARLLFQAQRLQYLQLQEQSPSLELEASRFMRQRKDLFVDVMRWLHKKHPDRESLLANPSDRRLLEVVSPCVSAHSSYF